MRKGRFYVMFAVLLSVTTIGFNAGPSDAGAVELKFAHFMSPRHVQHVNSFEPFCKKVEELSGGQVKITLYPGGALGGPKQLPDAVAAGITDIAFIIPPYTTARFPNVSVLDLPFLCDSAVHATKVAYELWDEWVSKDFKDYKVLWLYSAGTGQFMSIGTPMHALGDIGGLKMRAPTAYMSKLLKMLGANPIGMPISELTVSLQKKVIDGMLTPYSAVKDFSLFDIIGHITEANVYVTPMAVVMNKDKWNGLPEEAKKAIDQAGGKPWGIHAAEVYDAEDVETLDAIRKAGKIQVFVMPQPEKEKMKEKVKPLFDEWTADMKKRGIAAEKLLEDTMAAIEKTR